MTQFKDESPFAGVREFDAPDGQRYRCIVKPSGFEWDWYRQKADAFVFEGTVLVRSKRPRCRTLYRAIIGDWT